MVDISERELNRLRNAVDELAALNEIAIAINVTMSIDDITRGIIDRCIKRVGAAQGAIFLLTEESADDRFKTFVREIDPDAGQLPFHLNANLTGWMLKNRAIFISNEPATDERLAGINLEHLGITSILAAPLMSRKGMIGILAIFNKRSSDGFDAGDRRFLGIVGTQAAKVIENAQLFEKEKELMAVEEEKKVAHRIQQGFLPRTNITLPEVEIYGVNHPAREVGGDFFDMFEIDDRRVFVSLGDVSGKGIPAALLMASAQAVLRAQMSHGGSADLPAVADALNRLICQFTGPEQYLTGLFGVYDRSRRCFSFVNAGHPPPMVVRADGSVEAPEGSDIVIGYIPDVPFAVRDIELQPGEIVAVYSDGVTEAESEKTDFYGEERLEAALGRHYQQDGATIVQEVLQELEAFRGSAHRSDDTTLVVIKVLV